MVDETVRAKAAKRAETARAQRGGRVNVRERILGDVRKRQSAEVKTLSKRLTDIRSDVFAARDREQRARGTADHAAAQAARTNIESKRADILENLRVSREAAKDPARGLSAREKELIRGAEFGQSVLGQEGLGRLQEDVDIQETLLRFKDISERGLSAKEVEAERATLFQGIDRNTQTALRGLQARFGQAGVRGATAGRQLTTAALEGAGLKTDVERDLFLKSAEAKRRGLIDLSERLGAVKTFDLAQEAREKDILLQAGLGQAQLGVSERAARDAAAAQERAAAIKTGGRGK